MRRWTGACALLMALGGGMCAWGQGAPGATPPAGTASPSGSAAEPAPGQGTGAAAPTISVNARLVQMAVTVREKKGKLVENLTRSNFTLQVDGKPQEIRYFNHDNNLPLTLGLLVDTSMSQRDALDDEKKASEAFVDDMLQNEKDKAFVVQFARQTDLLADVTQSKPKVEAGIRQLDTIAGSGGSDQSDPNDPNNSNDSNNSNNPNGRRRNGGGGTRAGTTLYDALFLSSDEVIGKQQGRKALIILSDGEDRGSKESLSSAIEAAQKADTVVYAIYFKGKEGGGGGGGFPQGGRRGGGFPGIGFPGGGGGYPGGGGGGRGGGGGQQSQVDGKKVLQRMADETGGRLFEASKKDSFDGIYKQIAEELRGQYVLGFTPDKAAAEGGYHQIDLVPAKGSPKDWIVQTRDGYYGKD